MKIEININEIKNETIHKLNNREIGDLGLCNYGVYTYHGNLKSRRNGFKTVIVNEWQTNFETETGRFEFIRTEQTSEDTDYAVRAFDKRTGKYIEFWAILAGCDFFKH